METIAAAGAISAAFLAVLGLMLMLAKLIRGLSRFIVAVNDFLSDWNGEVKGGVGPMPERVASLERDVTEIKKQVTPNGGDTHRLGDRIVRIERHLHLDS